MILVVLQVAYNWLMGILYPKKPAPVAASPANARPAPPLQSEAATAADAHKSDDNASRAAAPAVRTTRPPWDHAIAFLFPVHCSSILVFPPGLLFASLSLFFPPSPLTFLYVLLCSLSDSLPCALHTLSSHRVFLCYSYRQPLVSILLSAALLPTGVQDMIKRTREPGHPPPPRGRIGVSASDHDTAQCARGMTPHCRVLLFLP